MALIVLSHHQQQPFQADASNSLEYSLAREPCRRQLPQGVYVLFSRQRKSLERFLNVLTIVVTLNCNAPAIEIRQRGFLFVKNAIDTQGVSFNFEIAEMTNIFHR